jgi:hypothetical protein
MAEGQNPSDDGKQGDGNQPEVKMIPKSEAEQAFKARDEAKATASALKAQLDKIAEDKLKEQGDFKSLLDQREKELAEVKAKLEPALKAVDELNQLKAQEKESIKKLMGDKWETDFENLDLGMLKKIKDKFVTVGKDGNPHSPASTGSGQQKAYKDLSVDEIVALRKSGQPMILELNNK